MRVYMSYLWWSRAGRNVRSSIASAFDLSHSMLDSGKSEEIYLGKELAHPSGYARSLRDVRMLAEDGGCRWAGRTHASGSIGCERVTSRGSILLAAKRRLLGIHDGPQANRIHKLVR